MPRRNPCECESGHGQRRILRFLISDINPPLGNQGGHESWYASLESSEVERIFLARENPRGFKRYAPSLLHFFQSGDALFDRRVGAEELVDRALEVFQRIDNI